MTTSTIATDQTILQKLERLMQRVVQLEHRVITLEAENGTHDSIVATYERDGITFEVTQHEANAMRDKLRKKSKPRPDEVIHEMVLIDKMTEYSRHHLTREQSMKRFTSAIDTIRAEAIADGTAISEEWEAAIND